MPESIRSSKVLSGNDLGMLANVSAIPARDHTFVYQKQVDLHEDAKAMLAQNKVEDAWQILLSAAS